MDEGLYQFEKSYAVYYENDPESLVGMFTETVQVYSNVQNGVGVVCAQSLPVIVSIDLGERKTENWKRKIENWKLITPHS